MITSTHSTALRQTASASASSRGSVWSRTASSAAMCIAVGKLSLDDWAMLTWSLGCTGCFEPSSPPSSWEARLAITSLTFMFDCVPDPVCQT